MTIIFETDGVQLSGNDASIPNAANSTSVTFSKIYNNPVVVVYSATTNGGQDVDARVANLTGSGCDLFTHEPDRQGHNAEFLYYAVAEEGVHETPEGHRIEAGVHQTDSSQEDGESFIGNSVSFVNDWASTPVLFSTPNTHNNQDWATVGIDNIGLNEFDISQQRGGSGSTVNEVSVEELGWIAVENVGTGSLDGQSFEVGTTSSNSASWSSFSNQPDVIVESQTRNGTENGWMRGNGQGGSGSHGWYFESSGSSQTSGYFAIEANSVVHGIDAAGDRSGTFEFRSPTGNYSTGGYDSLDGSNNPKGSGGTFSGVRETVGSVYETPEVKPTSVGELTGTAATTLTSSASVAQATGTEISGTVATMQNAVVNTENTITTTETGLGGTTASVDAILDGALTFTRTATGNGSTVSVGEVETASTIAEGSTVNTNALSGSTVEYGSANTFGGATTATVGGGIQNSSTKTVTSPTYTTTSGGTVTDAQSTSQTASGYTTTTPSASPTELHSGRKVIAEVYPERNKADFRGEWNGVVEYHEFDYLRGVQQYGDYYSQRVRGTLVAPESGTYYFWIAGDNEVSFWLDGSKVLDLDSWTSYNEWNKYPEEQKSSAITLEAGEKYYFEAYMMERSGGDQLQVGWRKPSDGDGSLPVGMVPADHLKPVGVRLQEATVDSSSFGGQVENATVANVSTRSSLTGSVSVSFGNGNALSGEVMTKSVSGTPTQCFATTKESSSDLTIRGLKSAAELGTETATAITNTAGGGVQSAGAQSISISGETAAGAVVISDGMVLFPIKAGPLAETYSGGSVERMSLTTKGSGISVAVPGIINPLASFETFSAQSSTAVFYTGTTVDSELKTKTASVSTSTSAGEVNDVDVQSIGDAKTDSLSVSPATPTTASTQSADSKSLATDGGSVVASTETRGSVGTSESVGGNVTSGLTPSSTGDGVTATTAASSHTTAAASNFGAGAVTATASIASKEHILSNPRVPSDSKASTVAEAEPVSIDSLGNYINPLAAAVTTIDTVSVNTVVLSASIFTKADAGGSITSYPATPVESPAFTETDAQGFTSAITWTLKSPATAASSAAGETQTISTSVFEGSVYSTSTGGRTVTLLSEILEGQGPTIDTPGLIPRVTTDTNIERYSRRVSVARSRTSTSFGKQTSVVIDDVTTDFNHYE